MLNNLAKLLKPNFFLSLCCIYLFLLQHNSALTSQSTIKQVHFLLCNSCVVNIEPRLEVAQQDSDTIRENCRSGTDFKITLLCGYFQCN